MSVFVYPILLSFISLPLKSVPKVSLIGYFTETEPINYDGRVYISQDEIDDVSLVKHVDCEVDLSTSSPTYRYYYNSTKEEGKILKIREIRNDVDSWIYILEQIQKDGSISNNDALAYRRTFNKNYSNDFRWNLLSGDVSASKSNKLDCDKSHNITYPFYFSSFLSSDSINKTGHANCPEYYISYDLIDPENSDKSIDRIHRAAVMDGINPSSNQLVKNPVLKAMISWAGDLQTRTVQIENELSNVQYINITEDILFEDNKKFPFSDLSADLDGFSIASSLASTTKISDKMKYHYNRMNNDSKYRYTSFRSSAVRDYYKNPSDWATKLSEYFEKRVYDRRALTLDDYGAVNDKGGTHIIQYKLLGGENRPSMEIRMGLSRLSPVIF